MNTKIISLFDYTGEMGKPWAASGYDVYCVDTQHPEGLTLNHLGEGIHAIGCDAKNFEHDYPELLKGVHMLFSFPPCTDLAVSGAPHFAKKLKANPNYRKEAMDLVYLGGKLGEKLGCPWFIENPVSVISTEWRKPNHVFDPFEFGGYIPAAEAEHPNPEWRKYIAPLDAYTKLTCIWTGGESFVFPNFKPVPLPADYKYSKQHTLLGGKSLKTKNIRSATPRGFALAMFEANKERNFTSNKKVV